MNIHNNQTKIMYVRVESTFVKCMNKNIKECLEYM